MPRLQPDSTERVTFRVSARLLEQFQAHAERDDRTVSSALRVPMREKVERTERRRKAA